jgi:exodeoxyribonuclease VII large subunit
VTAAGSAAYADFIEELERSGFAFVVLHAATAVQGRDADRSIAAALLAVAARQPDAIALVRGGGSRSDLACFDSELVARTIATLDVPVLTGIGHEIDRSIADEVAHTAHKTPTACAAALVTSVDQHAAALRDRAAEVAAATARSLDRETARVRRRATDTAGAARRVLDHHRWRLHDRATRVSVAAPRALDEGGLALTSTAAELDRRGTNALRRAEAHADALDAHLRSLDPERLLARGWTITRTADGGVARATDVAPGTELVTTFADGRVRSEVRSTEPSDRSPA